MVFTAVVIGASRGLGREVAARLVRRGETVLLGGRDADTARQAASEMSDGATGVAFDLWNPDEIRASIEREASSRLVDHLVVAGAADFKNSIADFDQQRALSLVGLKLVGYAAAVAAVAPLLSPSASIVLFGGQGRDHPYPGSTMVTAVNGGVTTLVRSLAVELAPRRVNAVHPGVVFDSPRFVDQDIEVFRTRTLTGRLASTAQVVDAVLFLLDNEGVNAINLAVDGGWLGM